MSGGVSGLLLAATAATLAACASGTAASTAATLEVHIVCHSHDDVGWLKTVDQYYIGKNRTIQHAGVQYIYDDVMRELEANPQRIFSFGEMGFMSRWWREQDDETRERVRALVAAGQLEIVNGGWVQHDEAAPTFREMVDQTTLGHRFIREQLGDAAAPRAQWQIDPFGQSATQGALMTAVAGYESVWFARIDYQDREARARDGRLIFAWEPSASLGTTAQTLAGAFASGGYGPPTGLCWDTVHCSDDPVQDDASLEGFNVAERVETFVNASMELAAASPVKSAVMMLMGSDFQYEASHEWFKNIDKIIKHVNADGRVHAQYSSPSRFADAVRAANVTLSVTKNDFFPYSEYAHAYHTGYFTSRPSLKGYIRTRAALLLATRQLDAFACLDGGSGNGTLLLDEAVAINQHHDAVSGTSKQHVAFDYAKRLSIGSAQAQTTAAEAIALLTGSSSNQLFFCDLLNVSYCAPTQSGSAFTVTVYNPLAQARVEYLRLPVASGRYSVTAANGAAVNGDVFDADDANGAAPAGAASSALMFAMDLPAMGAATATVRRLDASKATATELPRTTAADVVVENGQVRLTFDGATGLLSAISDVSSGTTIAASQELSWWNSSASGDGWGNNIKVNSGAYFFRPNGSQPHPVAHGRVELSVHRGDVVSIVRQVFADWAVQEWRIFEGLSDIEMEYTIGPIPIGDNFGKEVVSRFTTNISSGTDFFTDSNGREFQHRVRDQRPDWKIDMLEPQSSNYYPVSTAMFIRDGSAQLSVVTDRAQGGSSLASGQLELMLHRRLLYDDGQGVGEPLNETASCTPYPDFRRLGRGLVTRGKHFISVGAPPSAVAQVRRTAGRVYAAPLVAVSPASSVDEVATVPNVSCLASDLPENVELMTLQPWAPGQVLLRLAHRFAVGEDATLSFPANVSLAGLFSARCMVVDSATELSLTANKNVSRVAPQLLPTKASAQSTDTRTTFRQMHLPPAGPTLIFTLVPQQVRSEYASSSVYICNST